MEIIDGTLSDFVPRRAKAKLNGKEFEIISPLWKFQSFARNKNVTFDLNGHDLKLGATLTAYSDVIMTDSAETKGLLTIEKTITFRFDI